MKRENWEQSKNKWEGIVESFEKGEDPGDVIMQPCGFCEEFGCNDNCPLDATVCGTSHHPLATNKAECHRIRKNFGFAAIEAREVLQEILKHEPKGKRVEYKVFTIRTSCEIAGLDITRALHDAGISHDFVSKQYERKEKNNETM